MNTDKSDARILAVAGKGGVGKTSLAAVMVKLLVAAYPDNTDTKSRSTGTTASERNIYDQTLKADRKSVV